VKALSQNVRCTIGRYTGDSVAKRDMIRLKSGTPAEARQKGNPLCTLAASFRQARFSKRNRPAEITVIHQLRDGVSRQESSALQDSIRNNGDQRRGHIALRPPRALPLVVQRHPSLSMVTLLFAKDPEKIYGEPQQNQRRQGEH